MSGAQIYETESASLGSLLHDAHNTEGARLLLPELQRPYVWSPLQVIRLLDSLFKGWPLGTLLLWRVNDRKSVWLPSREFWTVVDRTGTDEGHTAQADLEGSVQLVLDGQQRLQSLLLAFVGTRSGFRLEDREWWEALEPERAKGRASGHWSFGHLCVDLEAFDHERQQRPARDIDYVQSGVLRWVVCTGDEGYSKQPRRPVNYERPLPDARETPGRFLRLSRLWALADARHEADEYTAPLVRTILPEAGVGADRVEKYAGRLTSLLNVLAKVKSARIGFLRLLPFTPDGGATPAHVDQARQAYVNAVVNIFTRLNSGGTPLNPQDISFAWVKTHWTPSLTQGRGATRCFEALQADLETAGVGLSMDELVDVAGAHRAVLCSGGKLLRREDLLQGDRAGPMASDLCRRWGLLEANLLRCCKLLEEQGIGYARHFESTNAWTTLCAWRLVGADWLERSSLKGLSRESCERHLDRLFQAHALRFIALSHWSGQWSASAALESFTGELAQDVEGLRHETSSDQMVGTLERRMAGWLDRMKARAADHLVNLRMSRRNDVRWYFLPLWIWHRLEPVRWSMSEIHMQRSRAKPALEVDHVVSHSYWEKNYGLEVPADQPNAANVNDLGNCLLLEKNFNISKSDKPLADLLERIDELDRPEEAERWRQAMAVEPEQLEATNFDAAAVREAVGRRSEAIRKELLAWVSGELQQAGALMTVNVTGVWETTYTEGKKAVAAPMRLMVEGLEVQGTYHNGAVLDGRVWGNRLIGEWQEGEHHGRFCFEIAQDGSSFEGTWGKRNKSSGGGTWSGRRVEAKP